MKAIELYKDIVDLIDWAIEDGVPLWEIYGVVSAVEKMVETVVYKGSLLMTAKETEDAAS